MGLGFRNTRRARLVLLSWTVMDSPAGAGGSVVGAMGAAAAGVATSGLGCGADVGMGSAFAGAGFVDAGSGTDCPNDRPKMASVDPAAISFAVITSPSAPAFSSGTSRAVFALLSCPLL